MSIILWLLGLVVGLLLVLSLLVLICPFYYRGEGNWREKLSGGIWIRFGPFNLSVARTEDGSKVNKFRILWIELIKKNELMHISDDDKKNSEKKIKKDKKCDQKKQKNRLGFREALRLMDREIVGAFLELLGKILGEIKPKVCKLSGRLGFDNPYHTGLFAASLVGLLDYGTGDKWIRIEPDFSGSVRDISFQLEGKAIFAVAFMHILKSFFSKPLRPAIWTIIKNYKNS